MSMAPRDVPSTDPAPRRRFRLRLWVVMLLLVPLAVGLAWKMNKVRRQARAAEALYRLGGVVNYDYLFDNGRWDPAMYVRYPQPRGPEWLRRRLGIDFFHRVTSVVLVDVALKDSDLVWLRDLPDIQNLVISRHTRPEVVVTDEALIHLAGLRDLRSLQLENLDITGRGLAHIRGLPRLESLDLQGCALTGA